MGKKINFCSSDGFLLNDYEKDFKQIVIDYLYNTLDLSKYRYNVLKDLNKLKYLQENDHYVSPNYKGFNYFLIFMTFLNKPVCVIIDKKKLSYHKNQLDMKTIFIIKLFVNTNDKIFSGTIFDGKIIQKDNKHIFLIQDCYILMNKKLLDMEIQDKMIYLNDIINTNFSNQNTCDNFIFKINKLYKYDQLPDLINNIIPNCGIPNLGLIFYPKFSGIIILHIETKKDDSNKINIETKCIEDVKVVSYNLLNNYKELLLSRSYSYEKEGKTKVLFIKKTNIPDVYNLYENINDVKLGIAHIPNMKISHYCAENIGNEFVKFNCIFNTKFNKWIPLEKIN
jgi:hypothetical protein